MRVRKPRVQRKERHLDRESDCKAEEEPVLRLRRNVHAVPVEDIEGPASVEAVVEVRGVDDGREHEQRTDDGVDEKLHRRVEPVVSAPNADQEVHRHQRHLEKNVEQHHVNRRETAQHSDLQQQHLNLELPVALGDVPRTQQRERRDEGDNQQKEEVEAVQSEQVLNAESWNPCCLLNKLQLRRGRVEVYPEVQTEDKGGDAAQQRHNFGGSVISSVPEHCCEGDAQQRRKDDERKDWKCSAVHLATLLGIVASKPLFTLKVLAYERKSFPTGGGTVS